MGNYCYFNGHIVKESEAKIGVSDLGLRRAYGAFDFMRAEGILPMFADQHFNRLLTATKKLRLHIKEDERRLSEIVSELLTLNNHHLSGLRFIVTGGYAPDAYHPVEPNFIITNDALSYPEPFHYTEGVDLMLHEHQRELAFIKSINYLMPIYLLDKIHEEAYYDVLYQWQGKISEVSRSNFFVVIDDKIRTPSEGILHGITRANVLKIAYELGIDVSEGIVRVDHLKDASEAFLTSTTKRIMPVTRVGHARIGDAKPGPITRRLMEAFTEMEQNYISDHA